MKIHYMGPLAMVIVGSWATSMATTACSSSSSGSSSGSIDSGMKMTDSGSETGSSSGASDGGSSGGGPCTPHDGHYTLTVTASSMNDSSCIAAAGLGLPPTEDCPGDAGGCVPSPTDTGCGCSGNKLTCMNTIPLEAGDIDKVLTLDFSSADWSGTETLTQNGVTCSYTITTKM